MTKLQTAKRWERFLRHGVFVNNKFENALITIHGEQRAEVS